MKTKETINFENNIYEIVKEKINIITGQHKKINKFINKTKQLFDKISLIDKKGTMLSNMNILTNLSLPLMYHTNDSEKIIEEKIIKLLNIFEFNYKLTEFPENLTLEDKKKLSVIRAIIQKPNIIIIYEISDINIYLLNKIFEKLLTFDIFIVCSTDIKNIYVSLKNVNIIEIQ